MLEHFLKNTNTYIQENGPLQQEKEKRKKKKAWQTEQEDKAKNQERK